MQKLTKLTSQLSILSLFLSSLILPTVAQAIEFRSVIVEKAILYDAPSPAGGKAFILGKGYPVEVIVNLGEWIKVRDHFGALNWVKSKDLSLQRTAIVTGKVDMKQSPNATGAILATLEKNVLVSLVSTTSNGWIKVKHASGLLGYVPANQLWGL